MIFSDFLKALRQLFDPTFRRVLALGVLLTLGLLAGVSVFFLWGIQTWLPDVIDLPLIGEVQNIGFFLSWGAFVGMLGLSVFLMVPVASVFTGFFLDQISEAVEAKHYPHLPQPPAIPLYEQIKDALNFFAVLVALNVLALAFAVFMGPLAPLIFWGMNGYLLGREYFTLAAIRRVGRVKAKSLRGRHPVQIWVAGVLMALPLSIPIVNLVVPLLGVATFTHLFHRLNGTQSR